MNRTSCSLFSQEEVAPRAHALNQDYIGFGLNSAQCLICPGFKSHYSAGGSRSAYAAGCAASGCEALLAQVLLVRLYCGGGWS